MHNGGRINENFKEKLNGICEKIMHMEKKYLVREPFAHKQ